MEQRRLVIAIALSFLIFLLWELFFVDKKPVQQQNQTILADQQRNEDPVNKIEPLSFDSLPTGKTDQPSQPLIESRNITINTPLYSAQISEKGAVFNAFVLTNYKETNAADSPLKQLISQDISGREDFGLIKLGFTGKSLYGLQDAVFYSSLKSDSVDVFDKPEEISFSWISGQGITVVKKYTFLPESYLIGLEVSIQNNTYQPINDSLYLSLAYQAGSDKHMYGFEGPSALINNKLEQIKLKKINDKNIYSGNIGWIATQDRYFISFIIPDKPAEAEMHLLLHDNNSLESRYVQKDRAIQPGTRYTFNYSLFFGPKSLKLLSETNLGLNKAVNFGMFDFIAKPCVWIMNFLYGFIPNYGVAIIILTIFIKLLLWPLGTKSYKSMNEMKKLQPLMAEIKEKYKKDKKQMNAEIMGLYKTYKINPMGGCLPMILQIPVFFALYRMLYEAIELRHAPFLWWINDLSAPDRLFHFGFSVPFMQPPYGIPVLTIIMGGTMFLQQKMTPPMGDPAQAKMMMFMPVVFTVIFINFSSGLVLYWLVNNILSISQQYYIIKKNN